MVRSGVEWFASVPAVHGSHLEGNANFRWRPETPPPHSGQPDVPAGVPVFQLAADCPNGRGEANTGFADWLRDLPGGVRAGVDYSWPADPCTGSAAVRGHARWAHRSCQSPGCSGAFG